MSEKGKATPVEKGRGYPQHRHPEGQNRDIHIQTEEDAKAVQMGMMGTVYDTTEDLVAPRVKELERRQEAGEYVSESEALGAGCCDLLDNFSPVGPSDVEFVIEEANDIADRVKEINRSIKDRPYIVRPPAATPASGRLMRIINSIFR